MIIKITAEDFKHLKSSKCVYIYVLKNEKRALKISSTKLYAHYLKKKKKL